MRNTHWRNNDDPHSYTPTRHPVRCYRGNKVTTAMGFASIPEENGKSYRFRMDMLDSQGNDTASCEAAGMGALGYMNRVDQDPDTRDARVSTSCPRR